MAIGNNYSCQVPSETYCQPKTLTHSLDCGEKYLNFNNPVKCEMNVHVECSIVMFDMNTESFLLQRK